MHETKAWLTETKEEHGTIFRSDLRFYTEIINNLSEHVSKTKYYFMDDRLFGEQVKDGTLNIGDMNRIYAQEILYRAHLSSIAAIYRSCQWIEGAKQAKLSGNAFTWTSAIRGFIEGCGDTVFSLLNIPGTLAKLNREFNECLKGELKHSIYDFGEIEKELVHFTHARRGERKDFNGDKRQKDLLHLEAESSFKYIGEVVNTKVADGVRELYKALCEIVHPASSSVLNLFEGTSSGIRFDDFAERKLISKIEDDHESAILGLPQAAFNVPLLTLRVLQEFPIFERDGPISRLRINSRIGNDIERYLKK